LIGIGDYRLPTIRKQTIRSPEETLSIHFPQSYPKGNLEEIKLKIGSCIQICVCGEAARQTFERLSFSICFTNPTAVATSLGTKFMIPSLALIGGTFAETPKKSKIIQTMYDYMMSDQPLKPERIMYQNGGRVDDIPELLQKLLYVSDVILWFPNVSNDVEKMRNVKQYYPHACFVTSKRNENKKYPLSFLVNHALTLHANLCVEFVPGDRIQGRIFDPLGNIWCDYTDDIELLTSSLLKRINTLLQINRQGSKERPGNIKTPDMPEFFEMVRDYGKIFSSMIDPNKEVKRFVGNTSFRCDKGFPSFRDSDDVIFVSRRNIDKEFIDQNGFVPTQLKNGKLFYYGESKPSVDTPIHVRLYAYYPKINYMIHSHAYIEGAPFTTHPLPCGALEEVEEIYAVYPDRDTELAYLNLIGHGSLVMSKDLDGLKNVPYVSRPVPEIFIP
jgi:hypothetical protein